MPSSTFFHLPEEKRAKLLSCARAEFARVPYPKASINRIIRAAGIPRGSFYMYFEDKDDLFYHLLSEYGHQLTQQLEQALHRREGDLFAAFLDFFDRVMAGWESPSVPEYQALGAIMSLNRDLRPGAFLCRDVAPPLGRVVSAVDQGCLDLRSPADLEDMLHILVAALGHALREGVLSPDPAPARARFSNTLAILARGMAKAPTPPSSHQ